MESRDEQSLRIIANTLSTGVMLVCGIFLAWYLTRRLGVIAYGEYAALFAMAAWFRFPVEALLQSSIIPVVAASKHPERASATYIRAIQTCAIISGLAALLVGSILDRWTNGFAISLWFPFCIDILILSVADGYWNILVGKGRIYSASAITCAYWIVRTSIAILLVENGLGALGVVLSLPIASATQLILCAIQDRFCALTSQKGSWSEFHVETKNYGINVGLEKIVRTMDLVVMKLLGADARSLGYYAAATSISQAFLAISGASNSIYLQSLNQPHVRKNPLIFAQLTNSMLRGSFVLIGILLIAVPFLPVVTPVLLGKEYESIQWVVAIALVSTALKMLLSTGRILNRATSEPPQIRGFFVCLVLINFTGLALALFLWPHGPGLSASDAMSQAMRCSLVPIVGLVAITVYSLQIGLTRSGQPFPWKSAVRILSISAILASLAFLIPIQNPLNLALAFVFPGIYLGLLCLLGELKVPWTIRTSTDIAA
jgi:hypothetical protein